MLKEPMIVIIAKIKANTDIKIKALSTITLSKP